MAPFPSQRWVRVGLILVALLVTVAYGVLAPAQMPPELPPRPAPPNRPDLPGAPPVDEDDLGYCAVGGPLSLYCARFDTKCVPLPTSLLVPVIPEMQDTVGWSSSPNASQCGTKTCWLVLKCSCGPTLLNQVCGD